MTVWEFFVIYLEFCFFVYCVTAGVFVLAYSLVWLWKYWKGEKRQ